jgi:hypothetical protein
MYEAARHWGDKNPWDSPVFVLTHRPEEEPDTGEFNFVCGTFAMPEEGLEPPTRGL